MASQCIYYYELLDLQNESAIKIVPKKLFRVIWFSRVFWYTSNKALWLSHLWAEILVRVFVGIFRVFFWQKKCSQMMQFSSSTFSHDFYTLPLGHCVFRRCHFLLVYQNTRENQITRKEIIQEFAKIKKYPNTILQSRKKPISKKPIGYL